jgi:hypothetical protein
MYNIPIRDHRLHRDHDSPCTKRERSSLVVMRLPTIKRLLGQKRPSRSEGGTQNKSSELGPSIQPSCITELAVKDGELWARNLTMNWVS